MKCWCCCSSSELSPSDVVQVEPSLYCERFDFGSSNLSTSSHLNFAPIWAFKIRIMCILCTPRLIYRQHIDRQSTDVSVDILAEYRPICRSTYQSSVGRYVDRDVSLDISADRSVKHRSICRLTLNGYVGRYVDREWSSDCRPTCRSIGYRHSADTSLLLAYW